MRWCKFEILLGKLLHRLGEELAVWVRLNEDATGSKITEDEVNLLPFGWHTQIFNVNRCEISVEESWRTLRSQG